LTKKATCDILKTIKEYGFDRPYRNMQKRSKKVKRYSRLLTALIAVLIVAVVLIACGKEDELPSYVESDTTNSETVDATPESTEAQAPSGKDTVDFGDLGVVTTDSETEPADADPQTSESVSETETSTEEGGLQEGGMIDDSGEHFGEIMTGTPGPSISNRT
jgi:hypothetical protein